MKLSKKFVRNSWLMLVMIPVLLFIYAPLTWLVTSSISTRADLLAMPPRFFPAHITLKNYTDILFPGAGVSDVARIFKATLVNSFVIAISTTAICLVIASLAANALARLRMKHKDKYIVGILSVRMIPEISLVIPLFIAAARIGLLDKPIVLIITYLSFSLPYAVWMLTTFFATIPIELEDAALIDGSSRLNTMIKIILPLASPGIISTALFIFLLAWDEFFFALIFTSTVAAKTVPVAIAEFTGRYAVDITGMMAGGVLAALPPVILALVFQRYIVSGISAGAVKG